MALKHVSISPFLSQDPLASQRTQYILFTCGRTGMALLSLSEMKFFVQLSPRSKSEDVLLPWGWETVSLGRFSLLRPLGTVLALASGPICCRPSTPTSSSAFL